ncbi:MAG: ABC transporter ATP-binding protein [Eubacteriales bacterium]|nr:ABC transporter ATP-binding protein [Eubacteriales bacterium]
MPAVIETHELTKYYGKNRGIINLNLSVSEGEIFGFIGPNGSGKSTTIRTLLGLINKTSGKAEIFGRDITEKNREILPMIGYMPSEAMFYGSMRVGELIRYSADLRGMDCAAEAKTLCERLQVEVKKKIEELSLGNRKKVGIVCALQHRPPLYFLDEPTSGLDPLMQKEFFSILEERNREGATVFLSSHVLSEVQEHCGRAAIIREGKIIACDYVSLLVKTTAKFVTLAGITEAPSIPGIFDLHVANNSVSFLYKGEINGLLSSLCALPLTDLTITEPGLEDVFLHYYEAEESK